MSFNGIPAEEFEDLIRVDYDGLGYGVTFVSFDWETSSDIPPLIECLLNLDSDGVSYYGFREIHFLRSRQFLGLEWEFRFVFELKLYFGSLVFNVVSLFKFNLSDLVVVFEFILDPGAWVLVFGHPHVVVRISHGPWYTRSAPLWIRLLRRLFTTFKVLVFESELLKFTSTWLQWGLNIIQGNEQNIGVTAPRFFCEVYLDRSFRISFLVQFVSYTLFSNFVLRLPVGNHLQNRKDFPSFFPGSV